jgi:enoyl-CoA hydratase/carnithine racemase
VSWKNITITHHDGVSVLALQRSVSNALNLELVRELSLVLDETARDDAVCGIVLTSTNDKFLSIGFDIPELYPLTPDEFRVFYQEFNRLCITLFSYPKPVIAAITGHAVAGGCILVLCCDYRYIAEGNKKMGLNEIKLGVPIPYPADRILRELVGFRTYRDVVDTGDFFLPEQLIAMGLVDRIVSPDTVRLRACERILAFGEQAVQAFPGIKQNRVEPVLSEIRSSLRSREEAFLRCWYSDPTRRKLQQAMAKF